MSCSSTLPKTPLFHTAEAITKMEDTAYLHNTREFSTEDYDRILLKETLFTNGQAAQLTETNATTTTKKTLRKLYSREARLFLHAVSLSDYLRHKRIPKGLRLEKSPMIGKESEVFCQKWCEITNKCSFDLMALTIEECTTQLNSVRASIQDNLKIIENIDNQVLTEIKKDLEEYKIKVEKEIKAKKVWKFQRDANDYEKNEVYAWRISKDKREGNTPITNAIHSSNTDLDTMSDSSGATSNQAAFLERGDGRNRGGQTTRRGRGRNAAGDRGRPRGQRT